MSFLSHDMALTPFCCGDCGVLFAVPVVYAEVKTREGEEIHCPNGHACNYTLASQGEEQESPKVAELRRQLTQALHRAEQAEARVPSPATFKQPRSGCDLQCLTSIARDFVPTISRRSLRRPPGRWTRTGGGMRAQARPG